jgi:hypothetical protein
MACGQVCQCTGSLQLRVLCLGFLQDGDVGVGVFPEREEIFVGGECPYAGGIGIRSLRSSRLLGLGTSHSQMRQRSRPAVPDYAAVVENPRKLGGSRAALSGC